MNKTDEQVRKALHEWENNKFFCLESRSMYDAARNMGVTEEQLSGYFQRNVGSGFRRWRTRKRIIEASRLLITKPDVPASAIGEMVGIFDRSNFSKHFKDIMGCTPAQWRKYSPLRRFRTVILSPHRRLL